MSLVVYGDFNCPYCCLASVRVDRIIELGGGEVQWRAVEHDPAVAIPSPLLAGEAARAFDGEIAEVHGLMRPGEAWRIRRPPRRVNTAAATAAFASAPPGDAHWLRRCLFISYFAEGTDIADPAELAALGGGRCAGSDLVVDRWRQEWLGLGRPVVPTLVLPDGYVSRGLGALQRLADLAAGVPPDGDPRGVDSRVVV